MRILLTRKTSGHTDQRRGQVPLDVLIRPVSHLVTQPEVDVMNFDLTETAQRAAGGRKVIIAQHLRIRPPRLRRAYPHGLQTLRRLFEVANEFLRRSRRPLLDLAVALLRPAEITRNILSLQGALEAARVAGRIPGQVGEHMADGPSGQPACLSGGCIVDKSGGRQEPLM